MATSAPRWARAAARATYALLGLSLLATALCAYLYFHRDRPHPGHTERSGWAPLLLACCATALFAAAVVFKPYLLTVRRCALMATAATLIFAAGIGVTWQIVTHDRITDTIVGTPLLTQRDASAFLAKTLPGVALRQIPTGVFVQSSKFTSPEEVEISGYVWQRYGKDVPESSMGVVFPEATEGYDEVKEAYDTRSTDGRRLKGWHFKVTLRQDFNYKHYPLDKQNVWLRMWSRATFTNDVLVPDFAAYPPWEYGRIGLDQDTVTSGWNPYYTGWSFGMHEYTMTQGLTDWDKPFKSAPELYFNVGMEREWAGPMMGRLIQSFFISAVLFLALFVYTKDDSKNPRFGFSTWTAISFAVTLLLVIVVDQQQIRQIAGDTSLTYLEYLAISQYIVIMGIFANAILLGTDTNRRLLEWRDNMLATLLYWPVLVGLFFCFTVAVFAA
ncbi:hypothetical protein GCM10010329_02620 [Streptomyces spiroverticillatus]|uniref:Uncharacterized protein n=1 Tax=Streptomyces finlayi TaxID=67296 RepID=A0A919C701_9ACTN|nr:hypothetical protein [Streptomyces finlayi]GGZ86324.1 hypothetical protein GCM10010329_02620 [Streptomyces spiroverticillatus]GHC77846.1 hypothetical protein GCM10010334_02610 [Streptomyces finlayi]